MIPESSLGPVATVVAHVPDLMDRSRLSAVAGVDVTYVADPTDLAATANARSAGVVVVDLARPGVLEAVAAGGLGPRVIGFGSHVDAELLEAARRAGCTEVLPRSRFFARIVELLRSPGDA